MIIKSGMNIYPQEVERKILEISDVKAVVVYGKIIDGVEQIAADIVLYDGIRDANIQHDIRMRIAKVLPGYMIPTYITFVEELQRNGSGKVLRPAKKMRSHNDTM